MTDYDVHPYGYPDATDPAEMREALEKAKDPRLMRDSQQDLHTAIDLAYAFASQLKALHPLAEKQVKGMIFQGNLI